MTIQTFKSKITPKIHGASLSRITSFYEKMREASANFQLQTKIPTLIRRTRIENAIYDKVYNYTAPSDMDQDSLIDIRPIGVRSINDNIEATFSKEFDLKKGIDTATVEYVNGQKTLRLSKNLTPRTILHRMDSTTVGGAVTVTGDGSNVTIDTLDYISGSGALKFDLSGATGQAIITVAIDTAIDLSDMESVGALFEWLQFPDVSRLTSVDLEWGSSTTDYWNTTITSAHDRSFADIGDSGWMLLRHDWTNASSTGSPDSSSIIHLKVTINYVTGVSLSNVRFDNMTAAKGEAYEVVYYSNMMFGDSTGSTWKEIPTSENDIIRLDMDGLNIFLYEFMLTLTQEIQGANSNIDYSFFRNALYGQGTSLYKQFKDKYPDQSLIRETTYYNF